MKKILIAALLFMVAPVVVVDAQESKQNYEIMKLIRQEKFDLILPGALRDNKVDMWIHVVESGRMDPLALDLGGWTEYRVWEPVCYYIFTDRGGDRIERIILGGEDLDGFYDIEGSSHDLLRIVEERNPNTIAINMSESLGIANGLSHTSYLRMVNALGTQYTERLVSAENVITDFRVRRVQREIVAFADILEIQRQVMEAALKRIEPGISTPLDIGWWAADELLAQGIGPSYQAANLFLPYVPFSYLPTETDDGVFNRGTFIMWDMGVGHLNFGTDIKRYAYVLKDDETDVPEGLKRAWERGQHAREILKRTIKVGRTAGETHDAIVEAMEAAGFVSTPSDDRTSQYRDLMKRLGDSDKFGFSVDMHTTGNTSVGDAATGAQMAPWRSDRAHLMIQPNHIFAFEFEFNAWIPEWKKRVSINFEDNAIVTHNGVEYLSPINEDIIVIR
ncbi:MAG: Xaa-Pro dipeptidase [Woeseiaceae bacterium]|jgi:Xaa-Pro dipeptidase